MTISQFFSRALGAVTLIAAVFFMAATLLATHALAEDVGYGPNPQLPKPASSLVPTIKVAPEF
jgi:hypothetical protein